jgi:hypothetical protein
MATVWIVERGPDVDPLEVLSVHHSHAGALNAADALREAAELWMRRQPRA